MNDIFASLSDEEMNYIKSKSIQKELEDNEIIFLEGDYGDYVYYIESGRINIFLISGEGKEKTLRIFGKGEVFGEMSIFDNLPRSASARTMSKTKLLIIPGKVILEMVKKNSDLSLNIIKELSRRMRVADLQIKDLLFKSSKERVIRNLLSLSVEFGTQTEKGILINFKLTQQDIANITGLARETVSRIMSSLENDLLVVVDSKSILIPSLDKLRKEASL
jgi:CRP/FNR family cyclic AMP-dependent transcriptional regulator